MNKKLALISDAGSPLISDPGYKLIQFCIKNGAKVHSIPGPNSIIPALQLSGIPIDEFYFAGFLPKTDKHINDFIDKIKNINLTSVFFVSSHKLKNCLVSLENKLPDRSISISKELTKINEKTFRCIGSEINESVSINAENLKGEFVVVVGKNSMKKTESSNLEDYNEEIIKLLIKFSLTDVVEIVHKLTGITKNKIYKWALDLKKK